MGLLVKEMKPFMEPESVAIIGLSRLNDYFEYLSRN